MIMKSTKWGRIPEVVAQVDAVLAIKPPQLGEPGFETSLPAWKDLETRLLKLDKDLRAQGIVVMPLRRLAREIF
jgi:hypothetical protein